MNLKARIEKIEDQLSLSDDSTKELENPFPDWTRGELANYILTGEEPEGKPKGKSVGYIPQKSSNPFAGWTREELANYILTGEKPQKPA